MGDEAWWLVRQALKEMVEAVLPDFSEPSLMRAEAITGVSAAEQKQRYEDERRALQVELNEAAEGSIDPCRLEELDAHPAALKVGLKRFQHARFQELLQKGFGTERYRVPFWRISYYLDHAAASALCRRLGIESFKELHQEFKDAMESIRLLEERRRHIASHPGREFLRMRLETLLQSHLQRARSRLERALESRTVPPEGDLRVPFLRYRGLLYKAEILPRIGRRYLAEPSIQLLQTRIVPDALNLERYDSLLHAILNFEDYASHMGDSWWRTMTGDQHGEEP